MSMVLTPRIISVFLVSAILLNRVTSAVHFTYVKKIYVCVCVYNAGLIDDGRRTQRSETMVSRQINRRMV